MTSRVDEGTRDDAGAERHSSSELGSADGRSFVLDTDRIGRYRLDQELRRGGMGIVYLAGDEGADDRPVALKMALQADEQSQARFQQEIRATRGLDHPGIVRIRDHGMHQGRTWYAMDIVGTVNLADVLAVRGPGVPDELAALIHAVQEGELPVLPLDLRLGLPLSTAVTLVLGIADAVAHAHARGVLHRDIKPANILLSDQGDPVLADFGVARHVDSLLRLTAADEVVGTYVYIAPEQLAGEDIDERADVYALVAVLHECLTGRPPPRRDHGCQPLALPQRLPEALRRVLFAGLEPEPERRIPSAAALATDLRRFQRGEAVAARGPGPGRRLWYHVNRHVVLSSVLLALALVVLLLLSVRQEVERQRAAAWHDAIDLSLAGLPVAVCQPGPLPAGSLEGQDGRSFQVRTLSGSWIPVTGGDGLVPEMATAGHPAFGVLVPGSSGLRITVEATAPSTGIGEISLFIGGGRSYSDGYTFQLGAYENSCSLLKRQNVTLWMGKGRIGSGRRYRLALELLADRVTAWIDGVEVARIDDILPGEGRWCGFFTYQGATTAPPVFHTMEVAWADAPELVAVDWSLLRLAQLGVAGPGTSNETVLRSALALSGDLLARMEEADPRHDDLLLRRGALLASLGLADDAEHRERLGRFRNRLQHRVEFHQQLLAGSDISDDEVIGEHIHQAYRWLGTYADRVRYACWIERILQTRLRREHVDLLLEPIDQEDPLWHFFTFRMADNVLHARLSPALQDGYLQALALAPGDSWWCRRASRELRVRNLARQPIWSLEPSAIDALAVTVDHGLEPDAFARMLLGLGGSLPRAADLAPWVRWSEEVRLRLGDEVLRAGLDDDRRTAQSEAQAAWLHGEAMGPYTDQLQACGEALPTDAGTWATRFPALVDLILLTPAADADPLFSHRLLASLLVVQPRNPLLRELARLGQIRASPGHLLSSVAWHIAEGRVPVQILPLFGPHLQASLRALLEHPERPPRADPPLAAWGGPWVQLLLAQQCGRLGDSAGQRRRLAQLADGPDTWPEAWLARRLLREPGP